MGLLFATITVLIPVDTLEGMNSTKLLQTCLIVEVSVLAHKMTLECRNTHMCFVSGTKGTE